VVRLGGQKRPGNLQAARRISDVLYNNGDGGDDDIVGGSESRKEEQAQLSVACVFFTPRKCTRCKGNSCVVLYLMYHVMYCHIYHGLPNSSIDTPKFGKHGINPDTGKCWCHNLYGESKCWGCQVYSRFGLCTAKT
jgi:hypothetical protein